MSAGGKAACQTGLIICLVELFDLSTLLVLSGERNNWPRSRSTVLHRRLSIHVDSWTRFADEIMDHPCCLSCLSRPPSRPFLSGRASGNFTVGGRFDQFHLSLPKFHGYSCHLLSLLRFAFELTAMHVPLKRQKLGKNRCLSEIWLILAVKLPHRARFRCEISCETGAN